MPSPTISSPLRWSDLAGLTVGLWGVGVEGRATLARLAVLGVTPSVVVDDATPAGFDGDVVSAGTVEAARLAGCDVVVKSPGVSRYRDDVYALEAHDVAVVGGLGLWLETAGPDAVVGSPARRASRRRRRWPGTSPPGSASPAGWAATSARSHGIRRRQRMSTCGSSRYRPTTRRTCGRRRRWRR